MTTKQINARLRLIQFSYLAALASFINYLVLYLDNIGFTEMHIGIIYAFGAVAMLLIQPLLGRLLDRTGNFRQVTRVVILFCIAGVAAVPFLKSLLWLELLLIVLLYAIIKQFGGVYDLWTYQLKSENPDIAYGSTRSIGSIGEGLATFAVGYLIAWCGFGVMFVVTVTLFIVTLLTGLRMPNPGSRAPQAQKAVTKARFTEVWNAQLICFVANFVVIKIATTLVNTFGSLMVQRLGGGSEWYGFIILLCGLAEVPVFILLGRYCKGEKTPLWYRVCVAMGLTGSLLISLAPNLGLFVIGRVMLTMVYAVYTVVNLEYVKTYVSLAHQGQVMLMIGAVSSSISYTTSSLLGGYLMEIGSQSLMAIVMGVIFGIALLLQLGAFKTRRHA